MPIVFYGEVGYFFIMKIYLDNCSLQRPLDDRKQVRIMLEAEAVLSLLAFCESGNADLISSEVLIFETQKNPDASRREYALSVLRQASAFVYVNEEIENRAEKLTQKGIKTLDALHLASAEFSQADYLCTTDDGFLKKTKKIKDLKTKTISPIHLIEEIAP